MNSSLDQSSASYLANLLKTDSHSTNPNGDITTNSITDVVVSIPESDGNVVLINPWNGQKAQASATDMEIFLKNSISRSEAQIENTPESAATAVAVSTPIPIRTKASSPQDMTTVITNEQAKKLNTLYENAKSSGPYLLILGTIALIGLNLKKIANRIEYGATPANDTAKTKAKLPKGDNPGNPYNVIAVASADQLEKLIRPINKISFERRRNATTAVNPQSQQVLYTDQPPSGVDKALGIYQLSKITHPKDESRVTLFNAIRNSSSRQNR